MTTAPVKVNPRDAFQRKAVEHFRSSTNVEAYSKSWKPATKAPGKESYGKLMNWPIGEQGEPTSAVAAAILGASLPLQADHQPIQPIQS